LNQTPGQFTLQPAHQYPRFKPRNQPFFFQDGVRTFFISHEVPVVRSARNREQEGALPRLRESLTPDFYGSPGGFPSLPGRPTPPLPDPIGPSPRPASDPAVSTQPLNLVGWETTLINDHTRSVFSALWEAKKRYIFHSFYHPYACLFLQQLNRFGLAGLLDPDPRAPESGGGLFRQQTNAVYFDREFNPNRDVVAPEIDDPKDAIDFEFAAAYSQYNWELFFHAPLLIADRLKQNQRFAEAQRWFHYIFDPTIGQESSDTSESRSSRYNQARFWKVRPFF
jgi:hypothetical protein